MTVEKLSELQQQLENGQPLEPGQCATLVAEVWRLKTVIAGKTMEVRTARDEARDLQASLESARAENESLRREVEELKDIHGLPVCELENRWSNCAVRMRKRATEKAQREAPKR